ncbi:DUF2062 domain-containing protein [Phormidium sp. CCY1219]|uniref:DUF2062 domain-containing protein n=1 Tax=Phormidium sp. CCY1219 TaxID=2886104 RepID=UPI002D1E7370|nr:DUF2062 domain-containing protein [Phormidium sp. CCY1219]MEB3831364.1 DUF2062 domain-containing protein [Phormidium sp. CCY1219]
MNQLSWWLAAKKLIFALAKGWKNLQQQVVSEKRLRKIRQAIARGLFGEGKSQSPWQRRLRYWYCRLLRQKGSPEFLARGLAVGVFAGLFPLFGIQTLFGIALAIPFRGSKLLAAAGTWISNPITYGPIYFINFEVGQWLLGSHEVFEIENLESVDALLEVGAEFITSLFAGSLVMASVCSLVAYCVGLTVIRRWRGEGNGNWTGKFNRELDPN